MGRHSYRAKVYEPSHLEIVVKIEGVDVIYATQLKGAARYSLLDALREEYGSQNVRALTQQERNTYASSSGGFRKAVA